MSRVFSALACAALAACGPDSGGSGPGLDAAMAGQDVPQGAPADSGAIGVERPDAGHGHADVGVAPPEPVRLLDSRPADGAAEVYPAPLGPSGGIVLKLQLTFDGPLDPSARQLRVIDAVGDARVVEGEVDASGRILTVNLRPPLGQRTALAPSSHQHVDLGALRSLAGGSVLGRLEFTTAALDELLSHACGHVLLGPFAQVEASLQASDAPRASTGHTRYTVRLPAGGGFVSLWASRDSRLTLFLDRTPTLTLDDGRALVVTATPEACAGISARASLELLAGAPRTLRIQSGDRELAMIVELDLD
jgi:hypothetical protein